MRNGAGSGIAVAVIVKVVLLTFNLDPSVLVVCPAEVETLSFIGHAPRTNTLAIVALKLIVQALNLNRSSSGIAVFSKIIPLIFGVDINPTCLGKLACYDILPTVLVVSVESSIHSRANTIIAEVIVITILLVLIARNALDSGQGHVVNIIVQIVTGLLPAIPRRLIQRKAVLEGLIGSSEMAALLRGAFIQMLGVLVRIDSIRFLPSRSIGSCKSAVQGAGTQIDVIAQRTAVGDGEALVFIPSRAVFGRCLDAAQNDNRVCGVFVNCFRLLVPAANNRQCVGLFIKARACQREIIVDQRHTGIINVEIFIQLESKCDGGLLADALGQLKQQIPRANALHIAAGDQVQDRREIFRNRHRAHIQRKDIGDIHFLRRI